MQQLFGTSMLGIAIFCTASIFWPTAVAQAASTQNIQCSGFWQSIDCHETANTDAMISWSLINTTAAMRRHGIPLRDASLPQDCLPPVVAASGGLTTKTHDDAEPGEGTAIARSGGTSGNVVAIGEGGGGSSSSDVPVGDDGRGGSGNVVPIGEGNGGVIRIGKGGDAVGGGNSVNDNGSGSSEGGTGPIGGTGAIDSDSRPEVRGYRLCRGRRRRTEMALRRH